MEMGLGGIGGNGMRRLDVEALLKMRTCKSATSRAQSLKSSPIIQ